MGKYKKIFDKILSGKSDSNFNFNDIVNLLIRLEFEQRIKGSHHIFSKIGLNEIINIQPLGDKAKAYQVKQIRNIILTNEIQFTDENN